MGGYVDRRRSRCLDRRVVGSTVTHYTMRKLSGTDLENKRRDLVLFYVTFYALVSTISVFDGTMLT